MHNTLAIQDGPDPTTASLTPVFGGTADEPGPFFTAEPGTWLWPMAGVRTPAGVVVFLMRVRSARPDLPTMLDAWRAEGSLHFFEVFGWAAALIANPDDDPALWRHRMIETPPVVDRVMPGAGAFCDGEHLYAYGWRDGHELRPGLLRKRPRYHGHWRPRQAFLARWPVAAIGSGLQHPQWWTGTGWGADLAEAVSVIDSPATEFTVHRDGDELVLTEAAPWFHGVDGVRALHWLRVLKRLPSTGRLLSLLGLIPVSVSTRRAPAPHGPWSRPQRAFTPEVAKDVLVYAGKAHPQLSGPGLVCSYAQIALKADRTLDDDSLYYPRFVVIA